MNHTCEVSGMALKEKMQMIGNWLFRWRSYPPLLVLGLALVGMRDFSYLGNSHTWDLVWEGFCLAVSFFGLGVRSFVIGYVPEGTSGRNTLMQKARSLNVTGFYSVVRHPLYLGNFFIWLGISLYVQNWLISVTCMLIFWLYYERITFAEEEFLRETFGEKFEKWADTTPCFFPDFRKWASPERAFSWKKVLKDEYSGFFAIIATFTFLEVVGDLIVKRKLIFDGVWCLIFLMGVSAYLILRTLKKKGVLEMPQHVRGEGM